MRSECLVLVACKLKIGRKLFFRPLLFLNISFCYFSTVGWKQDYLKPFWEKEKEGNILFHTCSMLWLMRPLAYSMLLLFWTQPCLEKSKYIFKTGNGGLLHHFPQEKCNFSPFMSAGQKIPNSRDGSLSVYLVSVPRGIWRQVWACPT